MRPKRSAARTAWIVAGALVLGACGARSGLDEPDDADAGVEDAAPSPIPTSTVDATVPPPDAARPPPRDSSMQDGPLDATDADDAFDADDAAEEPPVPPIDASVPDTATTCPDGGDSIAYLVAENGNFYSFDPPTLTSQLLGTIACPILTANASPFTMTVALDAAYVLYSDGELFRVDLQTLACTATPYVDGQLGFPNDVGIATTPGSPEGLLVYGCFTDPDGGACAPAIATADFTTFQLSLVATVSPPPVAGFPIDVKEDAYGRLFGCDGSGNLLWLDTATGALLGEDQSNVVTGPTWAMLTWRDRIFVFGTALGNINRFDLATQTLTPVGTIGDDIVGAGAAPCVP